MKSRTSFFNATVLRKDITRYAPVWGLYTIGLLIFLLIPSLSGSANSLARDLCDLPLSGLHLIYGGICALMVFGDLFKPRLCYATHALPLRREGWFLTHYTAGMLFSFVPHLFIALCMLPVLQSNWYMAFLWLALCTLQYFFFFSAGAFCAVCAGNRLGTVAAYLILNFWPLLVIWYAEDIYTPLLYGIEYSMTFFEQFVVAVELSNSDYFIYTKPFRLVAFVGETWLYLGIAAAVGIVLAVLAVLIYRKRNLESAGDFLSLKATKPVFLLVYTLSVAYVLNLLVEPVFLGMFIGLFVGFFTGSMLLERTVKVFRGWNFLKFGILTTVLFLSIGLTVLDPIGLTRYVPDTEDVEALYFNGSAGYISGTEDYTIQDPDTIGQFRQFHKEVSDGRYEDSEERTINVDLTYILKNGRTVRRNYNVPVYSEHGRFVEQKMSQWEQVFAFADWDALINRRTQAELEIHIGEQMGHFTITDKAQIQGLLEAVKADCDDGNMAQHWTFHTDEETVAHLYLYQDEYQKETGGVVLTYKISLDIYSSCEHASAYIASLNLESETYE